MFPPFNLIVTLKEHKNQTGGKYMIFSPLGLNVHSSACKFNDFVMKNPDNCSFNHFYFSSILLLSALFSLAIGGFIQVNTLLTALICFLEKNNLMVYNAHKAVIYTYFLKKYK
jgi:hypothetical protein